MQIKHYLLGFAFTGFFSGIHAQMANTDSLAIVSHISDYQLKLAKLKNQVAEKTKDKNEAAEKAIQSAEDNSKAANKLSGDPQDKKLARRADNAASDARSDAKRARVAAERLDDLNKDIGKLSDKIAREQGKLAKYAPLAVAEPVQGITPAPAPAPAPSPAPAQ